MREHKYKAWDKVNKRWLKIDDFSEHIYFADKGCDKDGICKVWFGGTQEEENIIWVEYTGLKDKNGKEIYEGDILKSGDLVYACSWGKMVNGWNIGVLNAEMSEVIGNIYKNKELLART